MITKRAKLFLNLFLLLLSHQVHADDMFGYAINSDSASVYPIDFTINHVGAPIIVGTSPFRIVISPDKTTAYVTDRVDTDGAVFAINLTTKSVTKIPLPGDDGSFPSTLAISSDGKTLGVVTALGRVLYPIDLTTNTPGTPIQLGLNFNGWGVCLNSDGTIAYVGSKSENSVVPVNITTGTVGTPIAVGSQPLDIQITPDGETAYVVNNVSNKITPIDLTTNTPGTPISVGRVPVEIAITPDGTKGYVVNYLDSTVSPIDLVTGTATTPIPLPARLNHIVITADGKTAIVTGYNVAEVTIIDLETSTVSAFPTAFGIHYLACVILPPLPTAAFTVTVASAHSATKYDASSSTVPVGTIPNYFWDFGDGVTQTISDPKTTHTYTRSGSFKVTLTVSYTPGTSISGTLKAEAEYPTDTIDQNIQVSPSAPSSFTGKRTNKHGKQCTNKLTWTKSADSNVIGYKIVCSDGSTKWRTATQPSYFKDRKSLVKKSYRYSLEAYNGNGTCSSKCWTKFKK